MIHTVYQDLRMFWKQSRALRMLYTKYQLVYLIGDQEKS